MSIHNLTVQPCFRGLSINTTDLSHKIRLGIKCYHKSQGSFPGKSAKMSGTNVRHYEFPLNAVINSFTSVLCG